MSTKNTTKKNVEQPTETQVEEASKKRGRPPKNDIGQSAKKVCSGTIQINPLRRSTRNKN
jgi:hypothetical protein